MNSYTQRQMLHVSLAGAFGAVGPVRSMVSEGFHTRRGEAPKAQPAIKTRIFWTWDYSTEWALNLPGAKTMGPDKPDSGGPDYSRSIVAGVGDSEAFLEDYTRILQWSGRHGVDAVVVWGLLRDSHGGLDAVKKLCDIASKQGVRLLCGVGLNAYGGVYYQGNSAYSLDRHLETNPQLIAVDLTGNRMPHRACPSRAQNQEYVAESLRWLFTNLPLGGVQMETGDYGVCRCQLCEKRRRYPVSRFSCEDMALMYPIAAEAIRSISPEAWIVCETYMHPETYTGFKQAPDFGDGKPAWADECLEQFPKGKGIFVQWVADDYVKPGRLRPWTKAGSVSDNYHQNVMRAHFATYWKGHLRGELSIDWIADMVESCIDHGCNAISIFGEVSPFDTGAELNYLALENYGSAANPKADLGVFLRDVAGPLLGGEKHARDYLRYARLSDDRRNIPDALKDIYARCGILPPDIARRWVWLANYLASFVYSNSST